MHFLESLLGFWVIRVLVRVELERKLFMPLLDFLVARAQLQPKPRVVVDIMLLTACTSDCTTRQCRE